MQHPEELPQRPPVPPQGYGRQTPVQPQPYGGPMAQPQPYGPPPVQSQPYGGPAASNDAQQPPATTPYRPPTQAYPHLSPEQGLRERVRQRVETVERIGELFIRVSLTHVVFVVTTTCCLGLVGLALIYHAWNSTSGPAGTTVPGIIEFGAGIPLFIFFGLLGFPATISSLSRGAGVRFTPEGLCVITKGPFGGVEEAHWEDIDEISPSGNEHVHVSVNRVWTIPGRKDPSTGRTPKKVEKIRFPSNLECSNQEVLAFTKELHRLHGSAHTPRPGVADSHQPAVQPHPRAPRERAFHERLRQRVDTVERTGELFIKPSPRRTTKLLIWHGALGGAGAALLYYVFGSPFPQTAGETMWRTLALGAGLPLFGFFGIVGVSGTIIGLLPPGIEVRFTQEGLRVTRGPLGGVEEARWEEIEEIGIEGHSVKFAWTIPEKSGLLTGRTPAKNEKVTIPPEVDCPEQELLALVKELHRIHGRAPLG